MYILILTYCTVATMEITVLEAKVLMQIKNGGGIQSQISAMKLS
jgi:hypothetical protein